MFLYFLSQTCGFPQKALEKGIIEWSIPQVGAGIQRNNPKSRFGLKNKIKIDEMTILPVHFVYF